MENARNNTEDVIEIDLQGLFMLLLHWLWLIVLCGVAAGAVGFAISKFVITPQYESTTKVYILNKQNENTVTYSDVQMGTQLTKDYAQLIKSRYVLEQVAETCALTEEYSSFFDRIQVEAITDTRIIAITVRDEDPAMAQFIANEIRTVASEHIKNVMDIEAVNVAEEANLPEEPASPSVLKWTVLGLLLGVFLCATVLVIRFMMDDTIKTSEDIEKYLGLSTLAMIPIIEQGEGKAKRGKKSQPDGNFVGVYGQEEKYEEDERDTDIQSSDLIVADLNQTSRTKEME